MSIDPVVIPSFLIFVMAMLVAGILFYYYHLTRVFDYLLIGITFIIGGSYNLLLASLEAGFVLDPLLTFKLLHFLYLTVHFNFFIYIIRVISVRPPKILTIFGILWYIIMIFIIAQYELTELPAVVEWGSLTLVNTEEVMLGAAFFLPNGTILMGWGFELFLVLYRVFSFTLIIYVYITKDLNIKREREEKTKQLWLIANTIYLIPALLKIPVHLSLLSLPNISLIGQLITMFSLIMVSYISVRHSEALILSSTQLLRAVKLYSLVEENKIREEDVKLGMKRIINYVKYLTSSESQSSSD